MNSLTPLQQKFYLVAIDTTNSAQAGMFTESLKAQRLNYWHWMSNVWIVCDPLGAVSSALAWRLKIQALIPGAHIVVIHFIPTTDWAMIAPEAGVEWLMQNLNAARTI